MQGHGLALQRHVRWQCRSSALAELEGSCLLSSKMRIQWINCEHFSITRRCRGFSLWSEIWEEIRPYHEHERSLSSIPALRVGDGRCAVHRPQPDHLVWVNRGRLFAHSQLD